MTQLTHGGDWAGYRAQYGHDALDFSANVSPLGLPQGVANAIAAALPHADPLPRPPVPGTAGKAGPARGDSGRIYPLRQRRGRPDLSAGVGGKTPHRAGDRPHFCRVRRRAGKCGLCGAATFSAGRGRFCRDGFHPLLHHAGGGHGISLPAQQPHRAAHAAALVERILRRCEACGALLVVDECFLDFLPDCDALTAKALLDSKNLLILKAFTKLYGMARGAAGVLPVCQHGPAGSHAGRRAAVGGVQSGAGRRACRTGRNGLCGTGAGTHCAAAAPAHGRAAGTGPAGTGRTSKLPAVPGAGNAGRCPAGSGAWCCAAAATTPGWTGSWYRTAVRTGPENDELLKTLAEVLA